MWNKISYLVLGLYVWTYGGGIALAAEITGQPLNSVTPLMIFRKDSFQNKEWHQKVKPHALKAVEQLLGNINYQGAPGTEQFIADMRASRNVLAEQIKKGIDAKIALDDRELGWDFYKETQEESVLKLHTTGEYERAGREFRNELQNTDPLAVADKQIENVTEQVRKGGSAIQYFLDLQANLESEIKSDKKIITLSILFLIGLGVGLYLLVPDAIILLGLGLAVCVVLYTIVIGPICLYQLLKNGRPFWECFTEAARD